MSIKQWSLSRLQTFEQCPARAKYQIVDKLPGGKKHPAAERGTRIHADAEKYVIAWIEKGGRAAGPPPKALGEFGPELLSLLERSSVIVPEQKHGITRRWEPTDYFASDVWLRVVFDLYVKAPAESTSATVIDYKTGKTSEAHHDQLELYALATFAVRPEVETVTTALWYLDHAIEHHVTYTRGEVPMLRERWEGRAGTMLRAKKFPASPGPLCRWCPYSGAHAHGVCKAG